MTKRFKYIVNENRDYVVEIEAENEDEAIDIGRKIDGSEFEGVGQSFWEFVRVEEIKGEE
tara:strand:- start:104 stop:283 length:180 start_codon:yes stop_codon:yes gene_type:complete